MELVQAGDLPAISSETSACASGFDTASSFGAAATIRSAWRDSSRESSADGTRSPVIRPRTPPTSENEYIAAAAAIRANALMPKKASSNRPRTPIRRNI